MHALGWPSPHMSAALDVALEGATKQGQRWQNPCGLWLLLAAFALASDSVLCLCCGAKGGLHALSLRLVPRARASHTTPPVQPHVRNRLPG